MSFKSKIIYIAVSTVIILSACNSTSAQDKIYEHLEEAVNSEVGFEEQQDLIIDLEQQEHALYEEISDLGIEEFDKIKELSGQAITVIEERSEKIELEKDSIDASKEAFEKSEEWIQKLEDDKSKKKAKEMYGVMLDRYVAYNALYDAYKQSLTAEKELYTLLQQEDSTEDDVSKKTAKINDYYEKVLEENKKFNKDTATYNELKKEFYSMANIEVKFEED